jgi:hypothetical protein
VFGGGSLCRNNVGLAAITHKVVLYSLHCRLAKRTERLFLEPTYEAQKVEGVVFARLSNCLLRETLETDHATILLGISLSLDFGKLSLKVFGPSIKILVFHEDNVSESLEGLFVIVLCGDKR